MSRKTSTLAVMIHETTFASTSYLGNPSYDLRTSMGTFRTISNGSIGYKLNNGSHEGDKVELTLTPAGRVIDIRILKFADNGGLRDQISNWKHSDQDFI